MNHNLSIIVLILSLYGMNSYAQQANTWYFGSNAGISFNTSPVTVLTNSALNSGEGCASVSDSSGNILFYTDGVTVYNKLHQVMVNGTGLMGHSSSTHSAIVVKKPGSFNLYYIFTADAGENYFANGYRYSTVDMSLQGGLGEVTTDKNILLDANCTEKLAATLSEDGKTVWLATVNHSGNTYKMYRIDCNGINMTPVAQNIGRSYENPVILKGDGVGCTKFSPDGSLLATNRMAKGAWEIFKFNKTTGALYDPLYIPIQKTLNYGLEFSPNSQLLYIGLETGYIFQYKLDNYDSAIIASSKYMVDSCFCSKSGLQLGPDNRIYGINSGLPSLNVINSPNNYGIACGYNPTGVNLNGKLGRRNLPTFLNTYIANNAIDFSYSIGPDCAYSFVATSTVVGANQFIWDFGDGSTATGQSVSHSFPVTTNFFQVTLTAANNGGCVTTNTKMKQIELVRLLPKSKYGATISCGSRSITFHDSSFVAAGTITNWDWDFGSGNTSTLQHPSFTFPTYGAHTVRLVITASDPCATKDTFYKTVTLLPKPEAKFDTGPKCSGVPVNFFDSSSVSPGTIISWNWDFAGTSTSNLQHPVSTFVSDGIFPVKLIVTANNGCMDTIVRQLTITSKPVAQAVIPSGCKNANISFTDISTISSGSISSWFWNGGRLGLVSTVQHPSFNYDSAGIFTVKLVAISSGGCPSDTLYKTISIQDKPVAAFSVNTACGNKTVTFTNTSTPTTGTITGYAWVLDGGASVYTEHALHTFSAFGIYPVKLAVSTANGCTSDTAFKTVTVADTPHIDFALPSICLLDAVANFTNNTSITDGSSLTYKWTFSDFNAVPPGSDTANSINGTHAYSAAASYPVQLIARSSLGCSDTLTKTLTVNGAVPSANFRVLAPGLLCVNRDVVIRDSSTVNFGNITRLVIHWGDGQTTTDYAPLQASIGSTYTHRYANFGTPASQNLTITEEAYSGTLCVSSTTRNITLHAAPNIQFNPLNAVCAEAPSFILNAASEINGLAGNGYYSGPGVSGTNIFTPAIAGAGNNAINYHFETDKGCTADSMQMIRVHPTPMASFTVTPACLPDASIRFTSNATVAGGGMLTQSWNFGDPAASGANPNMATGAAASHSYNSFINYPVNLHVVSPLGCVDDSLINLVPGTHIYPQPIAAFRLDSSRLFCEGTSTGFINNSDSVGGILSRLVWTFGDGTGDSTGKRTITHNYAAGVHQASLAVESNMGCRSAPYLMQITVESIPTAGFFFDTLCLGKPVQYGDSSKNVFGNITLWNWTFEPGAKSSFQNPTYTYSLYKAYTTTLAVATANGCASAPVSNAINIRQVSIQAGRDTVATIGQPLQLKGSGALNYEWSPATGLNNPGIASPVTTLQRDQQYYLKGVTTEGCIGYDTVLVRVFTKADVFVPDAFTPNGDGRNDRFGPICIGIKSLERFTIYNRWGQVVYKTKDLNGRWDGTISGKMQDSGTFVWFATAITFDGRRIERKGSVTLIK